MSTDFVIRSHDKRPLGHVQQVQELIHLRFPDIVWRRTQSGQDKLRIAKDRGIDLPPAISAALESLPSLIEGVAWGEKWRVEFGLGPVDPIVELNVVVRGDLPEDINKKLELIARSFDNQWQLHGDPK